MRITLTAVFTIVAYDAEAHDPALGSEVSWAFFFAALPLALAALAYGLGMSRLWAASGLGRTIHLGRAACFAAGWLSLAVAMVSPLERLATELFIAHMIEHQILIVVAAPLLVLSRPLAPLLWALPHRARLTAGKALRSSIVLTPFRKAASPFSATVLHAIALWLWHAPGLYEAALLEQPVHWLQHLSFLFTALLFWWALLFGVGREAYGVSIFCLFCDHASFRFPRHPALPFPHAALSRAGPCRGKMGPVAA